MNEMKKGVDKGTKNKARGKNSYYFLGGVIILYFILFLFDSARTLQAVKISGKTIIQVAPVFLLVIIFMGLIEYFLDKKMISRHLGESAGIKGWLFAVIAGILSHGPVYAWYPLLKDLQAQGMKDSLIAVFLYNRSVKIPMLPVMIYYFGLAFAGILLFWTIMASFFQGILIDMLLKKESMK